MKKTLIVLCSAIAVALVGCDQNRGGMGDDSNRDIGYSSSPSATTNTITPAPAEPAPEPATPDQSNKDYNTTPKD